MERYTLTADQAFLLLAQASVHDQEVGDIADHLVHTGEFPRR